MNAQMKGNAPLALVLAIVAMFSVFWFLLPTGLGQEVETGCRVNGLGQGSCLFTNTGWAPGTSCAEVRLRNGAKSATSGKFCSGRIAPNDTVEKSFSIVVGDVCADGKATAKPWQDVCEMEVAYGGGATFWGRSRR